MLKGNRSNYLKSKTKFKSEELTDIKEPIRRSMYQVLIDNLKSANRATYLHRLIYVGEHSFLNYDEAKTFFESTIKKSNKLYCIEKLSGFFLFYPRYFLHMVEGDEDNLNRHLSFLFDEKDENYSKLEMIKLLIFVSHINQRFFEDWECLTGTPSKLMETLDRDESELAYSARQIYTCIQKIYSLVSHYSDDSQKQQESSDLVVVPIENKSNPLPMQRATIPDRDLASSKMSSIQFTLGSLITTQKSYMKYLPEYELLDFTIQSNFTMKLIDFFHLYGVVPMRDIYKDRVWPVPDDFVPMDMLEMPFDCVTELSRAGKSSSTFKFSSVFDRHTTDLSIVTE